MSLGGAFQNSLVPERLNIDLAVEGVRLKQLLDQIPKRGANKASDIWPDAPKGGGG